jgi:hypothetical protein
LVGQRRGTYITLLCTLLLLLPLLLLPCRVWRCFCLTYHTCAIRCSLVWQISCARHKVIRSVLLLLLPCRVWHCFSTYRTDASSGRRTVMHCVLLLLLPCSICRCFSAHHSSSRRKVMHSVLLRHRRLHPHTSQPNAQVPVCGCWQPLIEPSCL